MTPEILSKFLGTQEVNKKRGHPKRQKTTKYKHSREETLIGRILTGSSIYRNPDPSIAEMSMI